MHSQCVFEGHRLDIHVLVLANGASPVADFLSGLSRTDRRGIDVLFERLGHQGVVSNKEMFKKIENAELFEFKRFQIRLLCFFTVDKKVIICHALMKKQNKHRASDLKTAEQHRQAYLTAMRPQQ